MDGSLFAFAAEVRDAARAQCCPGCSQAIGLLVHEKKPTSRLGEEAGTHRVDGGARSAVASRLTTLPIDNPIILHGVVLGLSCRTLVLCHCPRQRCATLLHC